jgi:hypothetical protein
MLQAIVAQANETRNWNNYTVTWLNNTAVKISGYVILATQLKPKQPQMSMKECTPSATKPTLPNSTPAAILLVISAS